MEKLQMVLSEEGRQNQSEAIAVLIEAANDISNATENDFNKMKSKKWYKRLWEMITFSKDNQKIMARNVGNLAKLQEIVMQALLILSKESSEMAATIYEHEDLINQLAFNQKESQKIMCAIIKEIERIKTGIQPDLTVNDLNPNEKIIVFNAVVIIAEGVEVECSEIGQQYFRALKRATTGNIQSDIALEDCIADLGKKGSEVLYRTIMEYLYLATGSFDCDNELLDFINISNKSSKAIKNLIEKTTKFGGGEALIDMGQDDDYLYLDDSDIEFIEEPNDTFNSKKIKDYSYSFNTEFYEKNQYEKLSDIVSVACDLREDELENLNISEIFESNKPIKFYRKRININNILTFNSDAIFEECIINYSIAGAKKIYVGNSATLSFVNCKITCEEFVEDNDGQYFISPVDGTEHQSISFEGCFFDHCQFLLKTDSKANPKEIIFENSLIVFSQEILIIENLSEQCIIKNNEIVIDNQNNFGYKNNIFTVRTCNNVLAVCIENNLFLGLNEKPEYGESRVIIGEYFSEIKNSTFINLVHCIEYGRIANCEFIECKNPIHLSEGIQSCIFNKCSEFDLDSFDLSIDACRFYNCIAPLVEGRNEILINACEFKGIKIDENVDGIWHENLLFSQETNKYNDNKMTIKNCNFDDIALNVGFLAKCKPDNKKSVIPGIFFESCSFSNLHSNRSDRRTIDKTAQVKSILGNETVIAISVKNCQNLDVCDQEDLLNENYIPNRIKADGTVIGASYSEDECLKLSKYLKGRKDMYHKMTDEEKYDAILKCIVDFLTSGEAVGTNLFSDYSPKFWENVISQFADDEDVDVQNIIGKYNGSIRLKDNFSGKESGILFLKKGFYFKQKVDTPALYMDYFDIKSVSFGAIRSKNGDVIQMDSFLDMYYSSTEKYFWKIKKIVND